MFGQKFGGTLVAGLQQDSQVAAIDNLYIELVRRLDQWPKQGVHFRGAAGQVKRMHVAISQHLEYVFDVLVLHQLLEAQDICNMTLTPKF